MGRKRVSLVFGVWVFGGCVNTVLNVVLDSPDHGHLWTEDDRVFPTLMEAA